MYNLLDIYSRWLFKYTQLRADVLYDKDKLINNIQAQKLIYFVDRRYSRLYIVKKISYSKFDTSIGMKINSIRDPIEPYYCYVYDTDYGNDWMLSYN